MFQSSLVPAMIGLSCSYDSWSVIVHPCLQMHAVLQLPFLPLLLIHDYTSLKNFNCSLYVNQTSCMSATICMYTACMSKYMHDSLCSHKYMPDNQYMWIVFLVYLCTNCAMVYSGMQLIMHLLCTRLATGTWIVSGHVTVVIH